MTSHSKPALDVRRLSEIVSRLGDCAGPMTTFPPVTVPGHEPKAHVAIITPKDNFVNVVWWLAAANHHMPALVELLQAATDYQSCWNELRPADWVSQVDPRARLFESRARLFEVLDRVLAQPLLTSPDKGV